MPYCLILKNSATALYTRNPKMSLLMAALAIFVLYTKVCRCSKQYVFFIVSCSWLQVV